MLRLLASVVFLLLLSGMARAECNGPPGPAEKAITGLAGQINGDIEATCVFYGDYTGDGTDDALVFLYFSSREGGNAIYLTVYKLRHSGGGFQPDGGPEEVLGMEPRDARFSRGGIAVTTSTLGPNDPRCCPSESTTWTIEAR